MPDEKRQVTPRRDDDPPASVVFMELMRQAAARRAPAPEPESPAASADAAPPDAALPDAAPPTPRRRPPVAPAHPPLSDEERAREAALEAQRVRRVERRRERQRRQTVGMVGGVLRTFVVVIIAGGLIATILTWFTSADFLNPQVRSGLQAALATGQATTVATPMPTPNWLRRIGIVSGHRGPQNDPGAVCPDGLTEASINFAVAQVVVRMLRARGYSVDLLDEFDARLDNYQAAVLFSIHANTCMDFGEVVSGYLIAGPAARQGGGIDDQLVDCTARAYADATGLQRHPGVTVDMSHYHSFREIHPMTPAAILELGFMLADRQLLTTGTDAMATGIVNGILCFLEPQNSAPGLPTVTPTP